MDNKNLKTSDRLQKVLLSFWLLVLIYINIEQSSSSSPVNSKMPRRKSVNEEKKSGEVTSETQLRWLCHDSALYFLPNFRPSALRQEGRGGRGGHRRQPRRGQDHRGWGHRECQQSGLPDQSFHALLETERLLLGRPQYRASARVD